MTPPLAAAMDPSRKRVEWSDNVHSTESSGPVGDDAGHGWDTEADHLLNYFLGDSNAQNGIHSPPQFIANATSTNGTSNHPISNHQHIAPDGGRQNTSAQDIDGDEHSSMAFDDEHLPPPTPAVQHYYHRSGSHSSQGSGSGRQSLVPRPPVPSYHAAAPRHHHLQHPDPSPSSQSHPMSTMASSLVNGGPVMSQHMQHGHPGPLDSPALEGISPISPAATIGIGQEPLMLPPPNQSQHASRHPQPLQIRTDNQSHLDWLREINALAKASSGGSTAIYPPHVQQPVQSPSDQQQHHSILPPGAHAPPSHGAVPAYPGPLSVPHHPPPGSVAPGPMYYAQAAMTQIHQQAAQSAVESEEKRARRLERNRESARKSRRRKKERLSQLEEQVAGLHSEIETERRNHINLMEDSLRRAQEERITLFRERFMGHSDADEDLKQQLKTLVLMTGPNCPIRRAVVEFQYSVLRNMLLPRYQKFLLWLTLHPEGYFLAGKEEHAKREGKQALRVTSGKVSSKQIGEDLTNGPKTEDGTSSKKSTKRNSDSTKDKPNQTCNAFDAPKMWPLLCFELSVSVDQEERFLQTHKRFQQFDSLANDRSQIAAATRMASTLKKAVMYQGHAASIRSENSYLKILTPAQTMLYQEWLSKNRDRCSEVLKRHKVTGGGTQPASSKDSSCLLDVCRKLEELLKISDTA